MASDKSLDSIFNWGDTILIKQTAPERYKPGFLGCVCGMRTIDSIELARQFNQKIGSELYLIEFANGETLEIPTFFLTLLKLNSIKYQKSC